MSSAGAIRVKRHRERQAAGRIAVTVELDEVQAIEVLTAAGLLPPLCDHSREDIAHGIEHAIEQLIELLGRAW
jgi:hypothetical protein